MKILQTLLLCAFIGLGTFDGTQAATFRCYIGSFTNFLEAPLNKPLDILPCLDKTKPTAICVVGYQNSEVGRAVTSIIKTLLTKGNVNVLLMNWQSESRSLLPGVSGYVPTIAVARLLAITFGKSLVTLIQNGIAADSIQIIGHSLGAQMAGWTGYEIQKRGYKIGIIYALDPSGPFFDKKIGLDGINPTRAKYVYGVHTNPGEYGTDDSVGIVDFWVNCNYDTTQPGCPPSIPFTLTENSLCSHDRSWMVWSEAILNPTTMPAGLYGSCNAWKLQNGTANVINYLGNVDPSKQGNFYFSTNAQAPYARGDAGLMPN